MKTRLYATPAVKGLNTHFIPSNSDMIGFKITIVVLSGLGLEQSKNRVAMLIEFEPR